MINSVEKQYLEGEHTSYKVVLDDGKILLVPHNEENRHYQEILEWVENGGVIVDNGA